MRFKPTAPYRLVEYPPFSSYSTQPSPADTTTSTGNTEQADLVGTSSGDEESSAATTDAVIEPARSSEKYVIP